MNEPQIHPTTDTHAGKTAQPMAWDALISSEMMWWPYRSLSKALLQSHDNLSAYMDAHRKLVDDMRRIVRREQDLMYQMSQKVLERALSGEHTGEKHSFVPTKEMSEIYDSAMNGMREWSKALADAQIRSLETLRYHTKSALSEAEKQTPAKAA